MAKRLSCIAAIACFAAIMLTSCTSLNKSGTFEVETGDSVKVTVDAKSGYDLSLDVPFVISKDGDQIFSGTFLYQEYYDDYRDAFDAEPSAELVAEGEKDGNEYFAFTVGGECDYLVKVADSNTAIMLSSTAGADAAQQTFESITIEKTCASEAIWLSWRRPKTYCGVEQG